MNLRRQHPGFTLLELVVVIAILSILMSILLAALWKARINSKVKAAQATMSILVTAMESYRLDFDEYPPDDIAEYPGANGSQVLAWYLGTHFKRGENSAGPYLESAQIRPSAIPGLKELVPVFNCKYQYSRLTDAKGTQRGYLAIDPGPNCLVGGVIDPLAGFIADGTGKDTDNIYGQ